MWSAREQKFSEISKIFLRTLIRRDNNAEGIVFRKRFYIKETFSGGDRSSKSVLKTYLRNLEKNIFCTEIYDFVVIFS